MLRAAEGGVSKHGCLVPHHSPAPHAEGRRRRRLEAWLFVPLSHPAILFCLRPEERCAAARLEGRDLITILRDTHPDAALTGCVPQDEGEAWRKRARGG